MWDVEGSRGFVLGKGRRADMGVIDFCVVYGCFGVCSGGDFFKCAFLVREPFKRCRVIDNVLKWR